MSFSYNIFLSLSQLKGIVELLSFNSLLNAEITILDANSSLAPFKYLQTKKGQYLSISTNKGTDSDGICTDHHWWSSHEGLGKSIQMLQCAYNYKRSEPYGSES